MEMVAQLETGGTKPFLVACNTWSLLVGNRDVPSGMSGHAWSLMAMIFYSSICKGVNLVSMKSPSIISFGPELASLHQQHTILCSYLLHAEYEKDVFTNFYFQNKTNSKWTLLDEFPNKIKWNNDAILVVEKLDHRIYSVNFTLFNVTTEDNLMNYRCEVYHNSGGSDFKDVVLVLKEPLPMLRGKTPNVVVIISLSFLVAVLFLAMSYIVCCRYGLHVSLSNMLCNMSSDLKVEEVLKTKFSSRDIVGMHLSEATDPDPSDSEFACGIAADAYDAFICYSASDRDWVRDTLLRGLEERGFTCCIDYRNFVPGAHIVENINDAIFKSRKTIAVLSPNFNNSAYCTQELHSALSRQKGHQVIPIKIVNCEIPQFLKDNMTYLDWCSPDVHPFFWEQLTRSMECEAPASCHDLLIQPSFIVSA